MTSIHARDEILETSSERLTVEQYGEEWIRRRTKGSAQQEASHLRTHVFPLIGSMALADVRPKHVRDLVAALKAKVSTARMCRGGNLAPRTVIHIYGTLRLLFKGAVVDDRIETSPVVVEAGVLPMNVDRDPDWRAGAVFDRWELMALISNPRIAEYRRVAYALEGLAGLRHGEMAGMRWSSYAEAVRPLGRLIVSRSGAKSGTKTHLTRQVPVHPTLATILAHWKRSGWIAKYGREPRPDDLIVPTEDHKVRKAADTLRAFRRDLERLGLRQRRCHDLRRTFITLALVDGARRDILKPLTHPSKQDILNLYTTLPWPTTCAEIAKLRVALPEEPAVPGAPRSTIVAPPSIAAAMRTTGQGPRNIATSMRAFTDFDVALRLRKP